MAVMEKLPPIPAVKGSSCNRSLIHILNAPRAGPLVETAGIISSGVGGVRVLQLAFHRSGSRERGS